MCRKFKFDYLIVYCYIIINGFSGCKTEHSEKFYEINNGYLSRLVYYNQEEPGPIIIQTGPSDDSFSYLKKDLPFFEFVIDHKLVSSIDHIWLLHDISTRELRNNGVEHKLVFAGSSEIVNGLEVVLYQQSFPSSTLIREKLELRATGNKQFQLNKLDGRLHFRFPSYSIKTQKNSLKSTEINLASWEHTPATFSKDGQNAVGNHMFYPVISESLISNHKDTLKGPINIITDGSVSWLTAYEHASQDNINGLFKKQNAASNQVVDAMQGVKGVFNFPIKEDDFKFLGIICQEDDHAINVSVDVLRGGYLDGELITNNNVYSTVWTATAFYDGDDLEQGKEILRNYLFNQISENKASRKPEFYYNTWGMQREISRNKPHLLRGSFTYDRIFREIDYASQLGVDLFVLDDGWEQTQGIWKPNLQRLPKGLKPIKEKLDSYGMKMGVWLSPMGINSTSERYKEHPDWIIKDSEGKPILAQWDHPAFDFVGPFFDLFIQDCKDLIDEGVRFFKWDAINTFYSDLPNLYHGSDRYSSEEIRARYEYLLPIYVTRAMEILTEYEPDLVIEMDVTEARRVMMGLAPLSQGKLFFMNNGASWYNDYTSYRAMSMRTIVNEYNGLIPLELFTYANYPHNLEDNMHYNVNNSLIAGHGFWGNLELMSEEERLKVGREVQKSKRVLPFLTEIKTEIEGKVGDTPEIYIQVNKEESAGQVLVFANEDVEFSNNVTVNSNKFLCVLNHPYSIQNDSLFMKFSLRGKASCDEAFIIPNASTGISIISSNSVIDEVKVEKGRLEYSSIGPGEQLLFWSKTNGKPEIQSVEKIDYTLQEQNDGYNIKILSSKQISKIAIVGE